jgi:hypothetical protein
MSILSKILDEYPDDGLITLEGFDDALIGVWSEGRLVYSIDKIIEILMAQDMSEQEAIAFYEFNIECAYVGERTPICIKPIN